MAKLKDAATRLWHWLILLASLAGAALSARFSWLAYETGASEATTPFILWGLAGILAVFALFCGWEVVQRVRALREPPPPPPEQSEG